MCSFPCQAGTPGRRPHLAFRGRASGPTVILRPSFLPLTKQVHMCLLYPRYNARSGEHSSKMADEVHCPHPLPYARADIHKTAACNNAQQETHTAIPCISLRSYINIFIQAGDLRAVTATSLLHSHPLPNQRLCPLISTVSHICTIQLHSYRIRPHPL